VLFWAILTENLVFLDETGMWLNFTRMYGRSKRGRRCHAKRPKQKGKIVTLIGAMALSGVIASLMYKGGTTKESFLFFIQIILVPVLWKGAVVVMDNLNVHTNQLIKDAIEAVGAKVLFLPTYSPELNAIEMLWAKLKSWLRKVQPRTREELDQAVSTFINSLSKKDVIGYFIEVDARAALI
jgi:transposase